MGRIWALKNSASPVCAVGGRTTARIPELLHSRPSAIKLRMTFFDILVKKIGCAIQPAKTQMTTEKFRPSVRITRCMHHNPGWTFFFLEEKLVPNAFENVEVVLICTRLE